MKKSTSEKELIKQCLKGKARAQRRLYEEHSSVVYAICFRYAKNQQDAQDLLQETFINVFNHLKDFKGAGSFEGWIKRIAVNCAIRHYKKNTKRIDGGDVELAPEVVESYVNVIDELSAQELMQLINGLSDGYRMVFNLYAIEGYSHKEIGEELGISESASRSQLTRARKILMEMVVAPVNQGQ